MKQLNTKLMHPAEQLALIIGRIYRSGLTTTSGGNLSIMDENGDMWITPAGIDKGSLTAKDIMCVKADGTIVGPHRPSSEYPFHKAIYKIRPKMHAVIHAHPPGLVTFSIVHQIPDTSILPQARNVCGPIGFAPYDVPGSAALGEKIAGEFKKNPDYKAVIMENHGWCSAARTSPTPTSVSRPSSSAPARSSMPRPWVSRTTLPRRSCSSTRTISSVITSTL